MNEALLSGFLLAASATAVAVAAAAVAAPPYQVRLNEAEARAVSRAATTDSVVSDSFVRLIADRAPFRVSRRPAIVRYNPEGNVPAMVPEQTRVPRPVLILSGIVWEPEPWAVVEGFPGVDGAKVVTSGEVVGGLKVRRIERERVVITGMDTTWNLSVKEPWK